MKRCLHALVGIATLLALAFATSAQANPIDATFTNLQHCDSLPTQHFLEELGDAISRVLVSRTTPGANSPRQPWSRTGCPRMPGGSRPY